MIAASRRPMLARTTSSGPASFILKRPFVERVNRDPRIPQVSLSLSNFSFSIPLSFNERTRRWKFFAFPYPMPNKVLYILLEKEFFPRNRGRRFSKKLLGLVRFVEYRVNRRKACFQPRRRLEEIGEARISEEDVHN